MTDIFSNLQNLLGVGSKFAEFLAKLIGGNRIIDLLYHQPSYVLNKNFLPRIYEVKNKELIIVKVKVEAYIKPANSRQPFRVRCFSPSGYLTLVFFKTFPNYIEKNFPIDAEIVVSGVVEKFSDELQMAHPDYVFPVQDLDKIPKLQVVYPAIANLSQKFIRGKITEALKLIPDFPEWIDQNFLKKQNWQSWKNSILAMHYAKTSTPPHYGESKNDKVRRRLAFDELLAEQIANLIAKDQMQKQVGKRLVAGNILYKKLLEILPFKLTVGQEKVFTEIENDLVSDKKMLRILQGDVGSGKTIVAFLAMLLAVENKKQAVIIAPITLLALQHSRNLSIWAEKIGIKIVVLTSKTTKKNRDKILSDLKNGDIDIIIGTHSLIEPDVIFKDLALIVIDEQHRFGVVQRLKIIEKSNCADVLLMSATPIPRSLMMTLYGDMEISILNEKPQNRLNIDTRVASQNREEEIFKAISRAVKNGEKIYWICPLIEESIELSPQTVPAPYNDDLSNITARYEQFQKIFGKEKVGIIHGKMKEKEKNQVMIDFAEGEIKILVATTVIEVGIDVKDATIMVIENCEQFGLSQLHQLRGRVGRDQKQSYCILLYGKRLSENGKKRMNIMRASNDGFFIAEEDLKLRGSGEMIGTRQSGFPEYKIANPGCDLDLFLPAKHNAQLILNRGINQNLAVRNLLKIFNYDQCLKLVFGG